MYPAKLKIKLHPDTMLRAKSSAVTEFNSELCGFCNKMLALMAEKNGLGLAAPQIGVLKRIFVTHQTPYVWINPTIEVRTGSAFNQEGCLSFPGVFYKIIRSRKITVHYQDVQGNEHTKKLDAKKGMLGIVVQHELDHLNGILFTDWVKDADS